MKVTRILAFMAIAYCIALDVTFCKRINRLIRVNRHLSKHINVHCEIIDLLDNEIECLESKLKETDTKLSKI